MNSETKYLIEKLNLRKLYEEDGYYRETYRSEESILINSLDNHIIKINFVVYLKLVLMMMIRLIYVPFLH